MEIRKTTLGEQADCFFLETIAYPNGKAFRITAKSGESFGMSGEIILTPEQPEFDSYVAIHNHSSYWCRPFFGNTLQELPDNVQALLLKKGDTYRYILPLCDDIWKTVIRGSESGMEFRMYTNCRGVTECNGQLVWVEAEGENPAELFKRCAKIASDLLPVHPKLREERIYPSTLNQLGWCSWDAMQIRVCEAGLLEKAREFAQKEVPVGFAIVDDMWADVPNLKAVPADVSFLDMVKAMHQSKLKNFEGDPDRFPNGMKSTVAKMKQAGIPHVGIWFPTTGYWAGILEGSPAQELLGEDLIPLCDDRRLLPNPERAYSYFDKLCGIAKSWDADFLKIDNQGCHRFYRDVLPIGQSAKMMQEGIESAVEKHFGGEMINCMGMPSECMFNRRDTAVSRCSDDFTPESKEWFTKNILQCSYNGILQGQFYVNDWDMWWTDDGQAKKNSLCRAISGGPIYVSDKIGRTNPDILKPLTLSDGSILRCAESAMPTADCLTENPVASGKPFKIRNRIGDAGVLAVFNLDAEEKAVSGNVCADDVELGAEKQVIVFDYFAKKAVLLKQGEKLPVALQNADDFRLYWVIPYHGEPVVLGRTDLFMGCGAVKKNPDGTVTLSQGGEIAVFAEQRISVTVDKADVPTFQDDHLFFLQTEKRMNQSVKVI